MLLYRLVERAGIRSPGSGITLRDFLLCYDSFSSEYKQRMCNCRFIKSVSNCHERKRGHFPSCQQWWLLRRDSVAQVAFGAVLHHLLVRTARVWSLANGVTLQFFSFFSVITVPQDSVYREALLGLPAPSWTSCRDSWSIILTGLHSGVESVV